MEILYVFADSEMEKNCSIHNCEVPAKAINKTGIHTANLIHVNQFVQNSPETQELCMKADIIIVERNLFQDVNVLCSYYYARNKVIMSLFDDDYPGILHDNISYPFWKNGEIKYKDAEGKDQTATILPPPLEQLARGVHFSAGFQTVSQQLADDWSHLVDTYVINNHLPIEEYMNVEPLIPHDDEIIALGWSGSLSHFSSWSTSGALNALKYVVRKYPQVRILTSGDKRVWDEIPVPKDKKFFQPFVPADKYKALVKSFDIYMIPLATEYDKRRSWIKALECCALKVPWIASDYPTYANIKQYGHVTPNGSKQWTEAISQAIENLTEYRKFAEEVAYPFSLTQAIDLHVQERIDLYQHVIEKGYRREQRPELSILPYNQLPGYVKP